MPTPTYSTCATVSSSTSPPSRPPTEHTGMYSGV
jgi:hypothetical protein